MAFVEVWIMVLVCAMGLPLLGSALISAVAGATDQRIVNRFGNRAQYYFSFLGIIVHELSHALMALIFRHKIDQIHLVQQVDADNRLGYVSHAWNPKSWYQQLGNFFIGMGPMLGIGLTVVGVTYLVWPQLFWALQMDDFRGIWQGVVWWQYGLGLLVVIQLCLALNLSRADWQNIRSGMLSYATFLSVLAIPLYFWLGTANPIWLHFGHYIMVYFGLMLGLSIVLNVIGHLVLRLKEG
ncbi:hypothetical protein [Weissella uvarum]|nr:hypothetical protein [Weissella uvarum]